MPAVDKKYLDLTGLQALKDKKALVVHPTTTTRSNAALKLTIDANGHITGSSSLGAGDIGAVPTTRQINSHALDQNISLTASDVGAVPTSRTVAGLGLNNDISRQDLITALGLTAAMTYIGVAQTAQPSAGTYIKTTIGSTTYYIPVTTTGDASAVDAKKGDVITVGNKEYVCTTSGAYGTNIFTELGDEGSYALKTVTISGGDGLTGSGTLASDVTISHATPTGAGATAAGAYRISTDGFGHVTGTSPLQYNDIQHIHTVSGSCSIAANTVVTGVSPTTTNYTWAFNFGSGNTNKKSVATRGTAILHGTANVGSAIPAVTGFGGTGANTYAASYDSTNERLTLLPIYTRDIAPAVASTTYFVPCGDAVDVVGASAGISCSTTESGGTALVSGISPTKNAVSGSITGTTGNPANPAS